MAIALPIKLLLAAIAAGLLMGVTFPSTAGLSSPRFVFAYGHILVCGALFLFMTSKGYIALPNWVPVVMLLLVGCALPAIKLHFS